MNTLVRYFSLLSSVLWSSSIFAGTGAAPHVISHGELFRIIGGLLLVLLIIAILAWFVRRLNGVHISSSKGFQTMGSMILGPKEKIILVLAGNRYLLLGVSSNSINLLHDYGTDLPEGFNGENKSGFSEILKSVVKPKK